MEPSAATPRVTIGAPGAYEVLAETSPHWITATDSDWRIVSANRAAADLAGVTSPDEMHGRCMLDWLLPEDRPRAETALRDRATDTPVDPLECRLVRRDGSQATGWGAAIDPEEARRRGIDRVLAKPYRASELRTAVASVVRRPRRTRGGCTAR